MLKVASLYDYLQFVSKISAKPAGITQPSTSNFTNLMKQAAFGNSVHQL